MINKKNIPLIIALFIPVVMIALVAAFIYFPGIGQKPKFNFLYATGDEVYYNYDVIYSVQQGKLEITENPNPGYPYAPYKKINTSVFYVYDVAKNESREVSLEEAKKMQLDPAQISSDGFEVTFGTGGGDFLFGGGSRDYNHMYIRGHNRSKQLNLKLVGSSVYSNFKFIGWIIN